MTEVWQLTRDEFVNEVRQGKRDFRCIGVDEITGAYLSRILGYAEQDGHNLDSARHQFDSAILQHHSAQVVTAYASGKRVPERVMAEYADYFTQRQEALL